MFETLDRLPEDPVLGLIAQFANDPHPQKLDLGIGVYMDERGRPPVMMAVKAAERLRTEREESKAYIGVAGDAGFNRAMEELVFGADHPARADGRLATLQTAGGCAALFYALTVIRECRPDATVWISDPTWINHVPLVESAGLRAAFYPYYDRASRRLEFDAMMDALAAAKPGDVVLLHACCHNPSGEDLNADQWRAVGERLSASGLIGLVDLAYHGFGRGLDADASVVRTLAETQGELFVAVSCSKSFGLYRDRIGALHILGQSRASAEAVASHVARATRTTTSMPPAHGAAIVRTILEDAGLRQQWSSELESMRGRIVATRTMLAEALAEGGHDDFGWLKRQHGMFSLMPLDVAEIRRLRADHGIYLLDNGRINLSGLNSGSLPHLVAALQRQA